MRKVIFIASILAMMSGCSFPKKTTAALEPWYPSVNENGDPVLSVYEGRIPCVGEMAMPDCNKIKVGLALYQSVQTKMPTTYLLARVGVGTRSDRITNAGTFTLTHGTALDQQAVVYQLDTNAPQEFRSYWVIGRDILFMLDQEKNPRVGDAAYSYVLNRMKPAKGQP